MKELHGTNRWGEQTWVDGVEYYIRDGREGHAFSVTRHIPFSGTDLIGYAETKEEAVSLIKCTHIWNIMPYLIKLAKQDGSFVKMAWGVRRFNRLSSSSA